MKTVFMLRTPSNADVRHTGIFSLVLVSKGSLRANDRATTTMTGNPHDTDSEDVVAGDAIEHCYEEEIRPSVAAVETAAAVTGRPVRDLPVLHDSVDADALDSLFETRHGGSGALGVTFQYAGLELTLCHTGGHLEVRVTGIDE